MLFARSCGAYLAAKAAGREEQIKFAGIDALPQEDVAYVKQGILDATFQYPTGGAEAIDTALKILHGETVPKEIALGTRLFDKTTVSKEEKNWNSWTDEEIILIQMQ